MSKEQTHATISDLNTQTSDGQILSFTEQNIQQFALGAAVLGTGGGGDPYIGQLMAASAIKEYASPPIISVDALDDEAMVAFIAMLGAPTVLIEKAASGADIDCAVHKMEQVLGKPLDALMPAEIGGINSTLPIVAAARLSKPLVNADGMGRAFPEIQMTTMNFEGVSATPFIVVDEHLNTEIVDTRTAKEAEEEVRKIAVQMGLSCIVCGYPMTGAQVKKATIPNTLTTALAVGQAIETGRRAGAAVDALIASLHSSPTYGFARRIFAGKVTDIARRNVGGFTVGKCVVSGATEKARQLELTFQNENLLAIEQGQIRAVVPDLIIVVDLETAQPIPTESLRFGQRVAVVAASAPQQLSTKRALNFVHPSCFGLDTDYTPLREIVT